ncbi:putative lysophospholipase L1 biosynthesis ABC-type transport system permease subunit [Chryseobacterium sp. SORGH_AS909]|uniref:Lysophospholipase L1 biosynthesis ABC-type transport system permease subunit n=2 Tax=Chryseobacterium group TaxID=2782232 RepID=A0ABU0TNZ0_9FLAO|nr:putative lysophospholipase L1 biosynthesis ABC-type transport system permease subunit [Chryseobacterium camelliae]MDQ1102683.1 putative lysophospholipase L1 biosynthesis ABC-type transport system permease subunit [Chryseobacterium sp. SORGH_AS_1048]MDR6086112.1 putative lysophospholipase L1 biosynthesis ABC-type transport system permease subunit [Chryseobacterium sp. SORGH_AS_0909]MDR6130481.1 putative lysophospholipase L1 biosynthesis ABC-type transport system permease subunit [Chryseobacter
MYFKVLFMDAKNYHEDLSHIRSMMERSSRFISLSGLSGVFAGLSAIAGAVYVYFRLKREGIDYLDGDRNIFQPALIRELIWVAVIILAVAILSGYFFTATKSRKKGLKIWDATTRRLLVSFSVPLLTGGVFCLALLFHHLFVWIAPATLIFYGIALVNAERYTLTDVKYLGYCQIILGLLSLFMLGWGLLFWTIGFGLLHIVYGLIMHKKYK